MATVIKKTPTTRRTQQKKYPKIHLEKNFPFHPHPVADACCRCLCPVCGVLYVLPCLGTVRRVRQWKPNFDEGDK